MEFHKLLTNYQKEHKGPLPLKVATLGYYELCYSLFNDVTNFDIEEVTGTETIHDLNTPIPEKYHNSYDLVIDGGTLEHIFNIPVCLESLSKLLRLNGVIYHINPRNDMPDHGLYQFSPDFYFSYYKVNGYKNPYHTQIRNLNCFLAQKESSQNTRKVIQSEYLRRYV